MSEPQGLKDGSCAQHKAGVERVVGAIPEGPLVILEHLPWLSGFSLLLEPTRSCGAGLNSDKGTHGV